MLHVPFVSLYGQNYLCRGETFLDWQDGSKNVRPEMEVEPEGIRIMTIRGLRE